MFPQAPCIFGKNPNDLTPQRWNFLGQPGWWRVPLGWFARREANGCITASPNSDFSNPTYDCQINNDGYMVFFDLGRNTQAGLMSPAQWWFYVGDNYWNWRKMEAGCSPGRSTDVRIHRIELHCDRIRGRAIRASKLVEVWHHKAISKRKRFFLFRFRCLVC